MDKQSITKLLVCLTGKNPSEFDISFARSTEFNLLEQVDKINIPDSSIVSQDKQRAIVDLIAVLYLNHAHDEFLHLIRECGENNHSIIESLEEGRLFLIALDSMAGISLNIRNYLAKYYDFTSKEIENQLFILLLRQHDKALAYNKRFKQKLHLEIVSYIKELSLYKYDRKKYYLIVKKIISFLSEEVKEIKKKSKKTESEVGKQRAPSHSPETIGQSTLDDEIAKSLDRLLKKGGNKVKAHVKRSKGEEYQGPIDVASGQVVPDEIKAKYGVYTNKFDEITLPKKILSPIEKKLLWEKLRAHLRKKVKSHSLNKFAVKLQATRSNSEISFQEFGKLDIKRLTNIIINPNFKNYYKIQNNILNHNHHISFLLDNSGSMQGEPIMNTIKATYYLCELLEKFNISTEILGFTTKHWRGGESYKLWSKEGKRGNPGRVNDLRHVIYKASDNGIVQIKKFFALMLKDGFLKENIDGEALLWVMKRLKHHPAKNKNIVVISDGNPIDEVTLELNDKNILNAHLQYVIKEIEDSNVNLIGCGINYDISSLYKKFINLGNYNELNSKFIDEFCNLLFIRNSNCKQLAC